MSTAQQQDSNPQRIEVMHTATHTLQHVMVLTEGL